MVEETSVNVYGSTGDLGDIIGSLPSVIALGGGRYVIGDRQMEHGGRESLKGARFEALKPLMESQSYIQGVEWGDLDSATHDFSTFRHDHQHGESLAHWQARHFGIAISTDPWLTIHRSPIALGRTVIAHSGRYRNMRFPWRDVVAKKRDALFVGLPQEYAAFTAEHRVKLEYAPTENLLELAQIIAGADQLFCNQSCPFWIAIGIGVRVTQETFPQSPNSIIERRNARYSLEGAGFSEIVASL